MVRAPSNGDYGSFGGIFYANELFATSNEEIIPLEAVLSKCYLTTTSEIKSSLSNQNIVTRCNDDGDGGNFLMNFLLF